MGVRVSAETIDVICSCIYTYVENSVNEHVDAVCLCYFNSMQELLFGTPPRCDGSLLVELSKVPLRDWSVLVLHGPTTSLLDHTRRTLDLSAK